MRIIHGRGGELGVPVRKAARRDLTERLIDQNLARHAFGNQYVSSRFGRFFLTHVFTFIAALRSA